MTKPIILIEPNHFLSPLFDTHSFQVINAEDEELFSDLLLDLPKKSIVFDFSVGNSDDKRALFDFCEESMINVYSDLSSVWGDGMVRQYRCLKGAFATSIESPKSTYEAWGSDDKAFTELKTLFESLNLSVYKADGPGFGFIFPRVVAQIANEAYFSLQDGLANQEAIDQAMIYGVGYPRGPLEWTRHPISLRAIMFLLDELLAVTGDPRYRPSLALREEFIKGNL